MAVALVTVLLAFGAASAQSPEVPSGPAPLAGPPLIVLVHHPYDRTDPLGIPAIDGTDAFIARYHPTGTLPYPAFVADGLQPIVGLPGDRTIADVAAAYEAAIDARAGIAPAAVLRLEAHREAGSIAVTASAAPVAGAGSLGELRAFLAVSEDRVHAVPLLNNGIQDHAFVVRAFRDLGPVVVDGPVTLADVVPLNGTWDPQHLSIAFWIQAGAAPLGRFEPQEVVQATSARLDGPAVVQAERGVLVEALSATWCEPCFVGDHALEQAAIRAGIVSPASIGGGWRYLVGPVHVGSVVVAILAGAAILVLAWRSKR